MLVDNGSTDRTLEWASSSDDRVTVLKCSLDYKIFQVPIKMWLTSRFSGKGWCLVADIDEYFDFPRSREVRLHLFLNYLNAKDYSGVACQTVDLFSDRPLAEWPESGQELRGAMCVV